MFYLGLVEQQVNVSPPREAEALRRPHGGHADPKKAERGQKRCPLSFKATARDKNDVIGEGGATAFICKGQWGQQCAV